MFPARYSSVLFALLLSALMSLIVSGLSTLRSLGVTDGVGGVWMTSWSVPWATAFPAASVVAPVVQWIVARPTRPGAGAKRRPSFRDMLDCRNER